jgi:hypothetical protein
MEHTVKLPTKLLKNDIGENGYPTATPQGTDIVITLGCDNKIKAHGYSIAAKHLPRQTAGSRWPDEIENALQAHFHILFSALRGITPTGIKLLKTLDRPVAISVNSSFAFFIGTLRAFNKNPDTVREFVGDSEYLVDRLSSLLDGELGIQLDLRPCQTEFDYIISKRLHGWLRRTFSVPQEDEFSPHKLPTHYVAYERKEVATAPAPLETREVTA